jgi:hypothetical protein
MMETGATPICLYHHRKSASYGVPDLDDMLFGGMAAFAGQWILLGHREKYDSELRKTRLWMNIGGRMGHGGLWGLEIDEQSTQRNIPRWEAAVLTSAEAEEQTVNERKTQKADKRVAEMQNLQEAIVDEMLQNPNRPFTKSQLAELVHRRASAKPFTDAIDELIALGALVIVEIPANKTGNHRPATGYRLGDMGAFDL